MMGAARMTSAALPKGVPLKQAGMFIGPKAKTWDSVSNAKAVQMELEGKDPRVIWQKLGNWKAPDGKWRQEIPDNAAALHPILESGDITRWDSTDGISALGKNGLMQHGFLEGAYPELSNINTVGRVQTELGGFLDAISGNSIPSSTHGGYDEVNKLLALTSPLNKAKSTTLHELQHAIQQREGWARGGSPEDFMPEQNL
jgi:hypothetical protein